MNSLLSKSLCAVANSFSPIYSNKILVHWWGSDEDQLYLDGFTNALIESGYEVTAILFDQGAVVNAFEETANATLKNLPDQHLSNYAFEVQKNHQNIIDVCCFSPPSLIAELSNDAKPAFIRFMRTLFGCISNPENQYTQLRLPSEELAEESGLSFEAYETLWHDLIAVDYCQLEKDCSETILQYQDKTAFQIHSGKDCVLTFSTEGRSWHSDHGNGDYPAGEVYIAPLENTANGLFYTPRICWEGALLTDVVLSFENGTLVNTSHPEIWQSLQGAPGDALKFAEFGIGLNPKAQQLSGYNLFDEKAIGSCHIAIGMNHLFGGTNESPIHIDFVAPNPLISATV